MNTKPPIKMVYLDWNVIVHLISGDYPSLLAALKSGVAKQAFFVPFTSVHVEEASKIRSKSEIEDRLKFLSELSGNMYFENSILDTGLVLRHPKEVKATLDEAILPSGFLKWCANVISRPMLMLFRKSIGIEPSKLNNFPPEKVWGEIDSKILKSKYAAKIPRLNGSPLKALIKSSEEQSVRHLRTTSIIMGASLERARASDMKISGLYSLLESFGYYPENNKLFKKGSRFAGASHCYYSQWAHICISRDKGFCMKSQAIAALTGSSVMYETPETALQYVTNLQKS
ncbi:MAG: hypothetical protein QM484_08280 [Woeseiaceae bacterium]